MESSNKTETVSVVLPGPELNEAAATFLAQAKAYVIDSPEMYAAAASDLREIVTKKKSLNDQRLSITRPLDEAKKRVMALFNAPIEFLDSAETILKRGITHYDNEQEQIRREEEAQRRREIEAEQRRLAEEAAKAEAERKRLEEEARKATEAGRHDHAAQLEREAQTQLANTNAARDAAATMPTEIVAATEKPAAAGISMTETWSAEVVAFPTLVIAVAAVELMKHCQGDAAKLLDIVSRAAAYRAPLGALQANTVFLGQQARSLKAQLDYPGVKATATRGVSARRVA